MTEQQAVEYLHSLPRMGAKPTLERMRALMARLGDPQKNLKFVHVAGTNGKGTVCTLTAAILQKAGFKVGLTISPFVLDFRERFQVNGQMIPKRDLGRLTALVKEAAEDMEAQGLEKPVEFEAVTAVAFLWFARQECDLVVLETGLGGEFDATNVIDAPLVAAITCIGLDHTAQLGGTLEKIAQAKCGIIKPGCTIVTYPAQPKKALGEILAAAAEKGCELVVPDPEDLERRKGRPFENRMNYGGYEAALPFAGLHQAYNASMAVEICLALWRKGYDIQDEAILEGLEAASFPSRIEVLRAEPLVVLDGCHNPDGARALAATLEEAGCESLTAVVGMMTDKDAAPFLKELGPYCARLLAITPEGPRPRPAEELAALGRKYVGRVETRPSLEAALDEALANGWDLLVCGSLYLASQARPLLLQKLKKAPKPEK